MSRMRIYLGTEAKVEIARKVLTRSIRARTTTPVEIEPMLGEFWEYETRGVPVGTGFSLRRWLIPEYCDWTGRAIYLDADMLCLTDIADLWNLGKPHWEPPPVFWCTHQRDGTNAGSRFQTSAMLIDCERARDHWGFDRSQLLAHLRTEGTPAAYQAFMRAEWLNPRPAIIPSEWNHLDSHTPVTRILHYTSEPRQPWYNPSHPLASLWQRELVEAIREGYIGEREFRMALQNWGVRQDHRPSNGLHPHYASYLKYFAEQTPR